MVEDAREGRFAGGVGLDEVGGVAAVLEFRREVGELGDDFVDDAVG